MIDISEVKVQGYSLKRYLDLATPVRRQVDGKVASRFKLALGYIHLFFRRLAHFLFHKSHCWETDRRLIRRLERGVDEIIDFNDEQTALVEQISRELGRRIEEKKDEFWFISLPRLRRHIRKARRRALFWKIKKYEAILLQLRKHVSPTTEGTKTFCSLLGRVKINPKDDGRFKKEYLKALRKNYLTELIPALRKGLEGGYPAFDKICEALFTRSHFEEACDEIIHEFEKAGKQKEPKSWLKRLDTLHKAIQAAPRAMKVQRVKDLITGARGHWNVRYDPFAMGNPAHALYSLQVVGREGEKTRDVRALAFGSPTRRGKITPEFKGFLRAYKAQKKKHLYISNQSLVPRRSRMIGGDERKRSWAILNLDKEFPETYFVCALAKNSPFYYQRGQFKRVDDAELFKRELIHQAFHVASNTSGIHFPKSMRNKLDLENFSKEAIETIHEIMFQGKERLTREERKRFIEMYYVVITEKLIVGLGVDSFNITCKEAIDRAAEANVELYAQTALGAGKEKLTDDDRKRIEVLTFSRALMVRKRAIIKSRLDRLRGNLAFAEAHVKQLQQLHQTLFPGTTIVPGAVHESAN